MRHVIAIDPGNEQSAWCELKEGLPVAHGKEPNLEVLHSLRYAVATRQWPRNALLAVEMIASYGMAVGREVFDTCLWIGKFVEAWESRGGQTVLVYRKDVKLHHCETTRATDSNIRAALIDRFGPGKLVAIGNKKKPGPLYGLKGDEWSALAVALKAAA